MTLAPIADPPGSATAASTRAARFVLPPWAWALLVSFLVSAAILLPFAWLGSASGHDFEFHAASWFDAAYQWHEGTFYPRWTAFTNHGFGEPRFIFYPPLSWMLGAFLTLLVPPVWVPVLFILLTQTFAGYSAFCLLRRLVPSGPAILGAAFFAANPDALLITYIRSDFAEQLAIAFFPLLLLAAFKLLDHIDAVSPVRIRIIHFALAFAAIWLCNAPAGVIATYSVAVLIAWATVTQGNESLAIRGIAALALGFGLTAFYLVPAAYEQRWVNISQALSTGLLPSENFLFSYGNDPDHTWFNLIASSCALLLIFALGVGALLSGRFAKNSAEAVSSSPRAWPALLVLGVAAVILTLPLSNLLWDYLPEIRFVQFPWRWMSILALLAACFVSATAINRRRIWIISIAFAAISIPLAWFLINNGWWDPDEMPTQKSFVTQGTGYDGVDEYDPLGDDHMDLSQSAQAAVLLSADPDDPRPPLGRVDVQQWTTERKQLRVRIASPGRVALRLLNYPAWRVTIDGQIVHPDHAEGTAQMIVPVPAGDSRVSIQFLQTPDRSLGLMIFSVSLFVIAVLLLLGE